MVKVRVEAAILALVMALLAACATTPADSPEDRLYAAESQFISAIDTAQDLRAADLLTDNDEQKLDEWFTRVENAMNIAQEALARGNTDQAEDRLRIINDLLIQAYRLLEARQEEQADG